MHFHINLRAHEVRRLNGTMSAVHDSAAVTAVGPQHKYCISLLHKTNVSLQVILMTLRFLLNEQQLN